jgi:hypothetical protein
MTATLPKPCFYARWFTREEKFFLKKAGPDAADEVANLRTFAGRFTRHLSAKQVPDYTDDDLKVLIQLVRISIGIGTLLRGNDAMQGKSDYRPNKSYEEGMRLMDAEC